MTVAPQMLRRMQELGEIINMYGWVSLLTCIPWAKKMVFFSCELA